MRSKLSTQGEYVHFTAKPYSEKACREASPSRLSPDFSFLSSLSVEYMSVSFRRVQISVTRCRAATRDQDFLTYPRINPGLRVSVPRLPASRIPAKISCSTTTEASGWRWWLSSSFLAPRVREREILRPSPPPQPSKRYRLPLLTAVSPRYQISRDTSAEI